MKFVRVKVIRATEEAAKTLWYGKRTGTSWTAWGASRRRPWHRCVRGFVEGENCRRRGTGCTRVYSACTRIAVYLKTSALFTPCTGVLIVFPFGFSVWRARDESSPVVIIDSTGARCRVGDFDGTRKDAAAAFVCGVYLYTHIYYVYENNTRVTRIRECARRVA